MQTFYRALHITMDSCMNNSPTRVSAVIWLERSLQFIQHTCKCQCTVYEMFYSDSTYLFINMTAEYTQLSKCVPECTECSLLLCEIQFIQQGTLWFTIVYTYLSWIHIVECLSGLKSVWSIYSCWSIIQTFVQDVHILKLRVDRHIYFWKHRKIHKSLLQCRISDVQ